MQTVNESRRQFLKNSAITAIGSAAAFKTLEATERAEQKDQRFRKAVKYHMVVDSSLTIRQKFALLKDLGFDGVEIRTRDKDAVKVDELLSARDEFDLPIHGVVNSNSPNIKTAVDLSKKLGGTSVLVVAGRVTEEVAYDANYKEWSNRLRENAPYAEQEGIDLLVENVWNNFLFSPLEMAKFIDEIESPAVGVYFDLGNVVRFGYPDQWIRILGNRIKKLDIKEYSRDLQKNEGLWKGFNVEIGDGDVDYPACLKALKEIGYSGWGTAEVKGGKRERLAEIAQRMNNVLEIG